MAFWALPDIPSPIIVTGWLVDGGYDADCNLVMHATKYASE
jgi:hypothetical protein